VRLSIPKTSSRRSFRPASDLAALPSPWSHGRTNGFRACRSVEGREACDRRVRSAEPVGTRGRSGPFTLLDSNGDAARRLAEWQ
jgi:hypothetical protein